MSASERFYTIHDIKRHYERHSRGHWFSPSTMRFFSSRLSDKIFLTELNTYLFVSSEMGPDNIRRYSIRDYNPRTFEIKTVGLGFRGYKTLSAALLAASKLSVDL